MEDSSMTTSVLSNIVVDILICGPEELVDMIIDKIKKRFTLGTMTHRPVFLRYFGFIIIQYEEYSLFIDADDKLNANAPYVMTRTRRRNHDSRLDTIKAKNHASINISIG